MKKYLTAVLVILFSAALVKGQDPGFFLDDWQERSAILPEYEWKEKTRDSATVQVRVDAGQVVKKVPRYIYGNNAVVWGGNMNLHATVMKDINQLNPHVLRWPGGNLSQEYFWNLRSDQRPEDIPADMNPWYGVSEDNWQMTTDEFYDLLAHTNSTGSICVNYSYARYGTGPDPVGKAAHLAAEWVRYDRGRTKFWEIGNENFGKWEAGYHIDVSQNQDGQPAYISGRLYGQHCRVFIDSMRAAAAETGAEIKIGVVAFDAESSYDPINTHWNEGMMPEVGDLADFLIVHSYFTPHNQDSNVPTILNSHDETSRIMTAIVNDMQEAGKAMIPVAMTEWNIFAVGSMQQVSYINGMHAALVLGEFVKHDYGMATRWDLTNGWNEEGNDHGMFSRGGEPGVDHYNPRPVFFYMKYFQDYFGDQLVESSLSGSEEVIAYASTFSSGEAGLVLINKGTTGETVQLDLENHDTGARYYTMTLTGGGDNGDFSRKVLLNGIEGEEEGGGPDDYESVKAFASSSRGGIRVELPPLSVVYLMVESSGPLSYVSSKIESHPQQIEVELSQEVLPMDDPAGFELLLNGISAVGISAIERDPDHPWLLKLTLDQVIHQGDELLLSYSDGTVITSGGESLPAFSKQKVSNLLAGDPFRVTFLLTIAGTGMPVGNCEVSFNGVMATSDASGKAEFSEPEGSYIFSASKPHLIPVEEVSFSIYSDTLIKVELDSMDYRVEFVLTDLRTGNPLTGVEISAHEHMETTGRDGRAQISLYAGLHPVSFDARNYAPLSSTYLVESDTILKVGMEQSHARVKFKLLDGVQPVNKAQIILGEDSLITGQLGIGTFASVALGQEVDYRAEKTDYTSLHGSLFVRGDTTLTLQMPRSVTSMYPEEDSDRVRIFPNPAKNYLLVESRDPIRHLELLCLEGEVLYSRPGRSRTHLELAFDLPSGIYLVRIRTSAGMYSSGLVVTR